MREWVCSFFMCWGMFLAIPCPFPRWDDSARDKMLVCFPLIGLIAGAIWAGAAALAWLVNSPAPLTAFILTAVPVLTTGAIHLDGFMDVCDAMFSRRGIDERRRILKDPHTGAFAVISAILLALGVYSLFMCRSMKGLDFIALGSVSVCTRAAAGIMVKLLPPMETSQYAAQRANAKPSHIAALAVMLTAVIGAVFAFGGLIAAVPASAAAGYAVSAIWGYKNLKGMNGDISGFALVIGEAVGVAVLVLAF